MQDKKITANEFANVKDIKDIFLYTKDQFVIVYLRIHFYNIDLLSDSEKRSKSKVLVASFEGDRKDFAYITYPREIDLDAYKNNLKSKYSEEIINIGRKHLLQELIIEATEIASNGENYEHQHFIKLWKFVGSDKKESLNELKTRAEEFKVRYEMIGIPVDIIKEKEILKMCNLFGNSHQAPYINVGDNTIYDQMTKIV